MKYNGLLIILILIYIMILTGNSFDTGSTDKRHGKNQEGITIESKYSIKSASYRQYTEDNLIDIDIYFPQIVGMEDTELQDKINKSIYSKCVKQYNEVWDGSKYELSADFEIKSADKNVISVVFLCEGTYVTKTFNRNYEVDINIRTGELISPDNYITE